MLKRIFLMLLIYYLCTETPFAREYLYPYYEKVGAFFQELSETGSPPPRTKEIPQPSSAEYPHVIQQKAAEPQRTTSSPTTPPDFSHNYKGEYTGGGGSSR